MLRIFKNLRKTEWLLALLAIAFIVLQVWLELEMPDYMSEITMLIQAAESEISDIISEGAKMLLCALGSLIASMVTAICASKIAANFSATLRAKLFNKVQSFSMEEIGQFSTASLITRSTNDIMQVQILIVMGLQVLIKAPITAIWAICKISGKSYEWTLSTAIAVIVLLTIVGTCVCIAMPKFRMLQSLTDDVNRVTRENLTGLRVVRAYNAEDYQEEKFKKSNDKLKNTHLYAMRVMSFMMPSIQLVMSGLSLSIYWIGAVLIESADLMDKAPLFAEMTVFAQYAIQVVMSFMMLVMIFIILPRASVSAKRINEVLDTKPSVVDGSVIDNDNGKEGEIEFRNVSFKYPDADDYVLENITFTAHKGETVAFIGATGCGKSTVINLVPRFYDATEGEVLVDGINVKEYTQKALRNKIGYVSQKAILFKGDIKSNIAYGDNGKDEFNVHDIENAITIAQAKEFVEGKEDKYDSYVAQSGSNFSGGQKQRISIARAICRKPEIFIFDDSFSALDYKTDKMLRESLNKECKDSTRLIVAQRIGTIIDADKIIVLDDGKIAGMGTHTELMKTCEVYQEIAYSQLSKEELA